MIDSFIARQPILNEKNEVIGYELLFRNASNNNSANFDSELEAGSAVLSNILSNFGQDWLLGGKIAFINVAEHTLQSDFLVLLNPSKTVFEITPNTTVSDELVEKIHALREEGFGFAFDDCALDPSKAALIPYCSYVKIDSQRVGPGLDKEIALVRKNPVLAKANTVLCKVETQAEQENAKKLRVCYYQGYFFEKPQTLKSKSLSPNTAALIQILNLARKEADAKNIEEALKKDVATSLKLLRYINSAGFGLRCEITSFKHAVQLLGYQKLIKWILLLLATSNKNTPPALAKSAVARGRFMEVLGKELMGQDDADNLFICGTFSLLDALLGVEIDAILPDLALPEDINNCLLNFNGPYYPFLMLAIASERGLTDSMAQYSEQLGLSSSKVNGAVLEAANWAEGFC